MATLLQVRIIWYSINARKPFNMLMKRERRLERRSARLRNPFGRHQHMINEDGRVSGRKHAEIETVYGNRKNYAQDNRTEGIKMNMIMKAGERMRIVYGIRRGCRK